MLIEKFKKSITAQHFQSEQSGPTEEPLMVVGHATGLPSRPSSSSTKVLGYLKDVSRDFSPLIVSTKHHLGPVSHSKAVLLSL